MATPTFREATIAEDEELAVILTNSFLPLWNHNWFQGVEKPLSRLPQQQSLSSPTVALSDLTPDQINRRSFYRFLIKLTRGIGGEVNILTIPAPEDSGSELVASILLWCPPYKRNAATFGVQMIKEIWMLYKAGIIPAVRGYGVSGFHRVTDIFEAQVHSMFKAALAPQKIKLEECGFVQMIAMNTDPQFDDILRGKGLARQLLQWRMQRHWAECKDVKASTGGKMTPVILDTTTEQGIEAYKRLGFDLSGQHELDTGTDKNGFQLPKGLPKEERKKIAAEAKKHCVMSIMIKMPPGKSS